MISKFFYLENKAALCSHSAEEEEYFFYNSKNADFFGFWTSLTSNNEIFNPSCLSVAVACLPKLMIVFSSYGCRSSEKLSILSSPYVVGFLGFFKLMTKNGLTYLKVIKYNFSSTYLAEEIYYPGAIKLTFPITFR